MNSEMLSPNHPTHHDGSFKNPGGATTNGVPVVDRRSNPPQRSVLPIAVPQTPENPDATPRKNAR